MRTGELRRFHYFLILARELHFGRAAELCFITQPALSQQIARLEEAVGVPLFVRDARGVSLTEAGKVFRDGVQRVFDLIEQTTRSTREAGRFEDLRLSVGLKEYANVALLPLALARLQALYPGIRLDRHEMGAPAQPEGLQRGEIDAGIGVMFDDPGPGLPADGAIASRRLMASRWRLLVREDHALAQASEVDLDSLVRQPLIMFARDVNPAVYDRILAACRETGREANIVYATTQVQAGVQLARAGMGCMLGTGYVLGDALPGMRAIPVAGLAPLLMHAFWRTNESRPLVLDFIEVVAEEARRLALGAGPES
ncbi:LysR substrate-binding domain-containing protein [Massilia sp. ST3]|uniref:LysR substrate-binding domain-containing protein n=1 Tax=Massilia sp. ST3 TaxID=2824903 RepID=UPI001B816AC2|nr:LysR substrate-binding domain-containing protein [Massilia sp. ST3]MBQ5947909.1 LysR family transcriptional regulator [Massilia sp. ST3]